MRAERTAGRQPARRRAGVQWVPRLVALACLAAAAGAQAMSFSEAYAAARAHDAQYRAAQHELDANRQLVPIARAALYPSAGLNLSRSDYTGTRSFPNSLNQEVKTEVAYASPQASLSVRMALFNVEAFRRHEQAQVQVEAAESVYRQRGNELLDRLGMAYLQVLLAIDNVALTETQRQAAQGLLMRAEQRFKRGEGTRTEVAQAQSAYELARVQAMEARDLESVATRGFKRVTGTEPVALQRPAADREPPAVEPESLVQWLELAMRQSPQLQARAQAVMAARLGVGRQQAGHYPRVDLVASLARNTNDSITSLYQTNVLSSIGVQVSVPLFNGGGTEAGVKQALADQARAEAELKNEREAVESEVQRQFLATRNGVHKVGALMRAVAANEVTLLGATRSLDGGVATTSDVLDAQARLHASRRDLAQARYDHLMSRLRLLAAAGVPHDEVVADVSRLLGEPAAAASVTPTAPATATTGATAAASAGVATAATAALSTPNAAAVPAARQP
ncbi:MAG: TolC family outer membrane protein [Aquabacterium sp.]|nr:TolC family outer membrane protein [Aquabacterium sp.]